MIFSTADISPELHHKEIEGEEEEEEKEKDESPGIRRSRRSRRSRRRRRRRRRRQEEKEEEEEEEMEKATWKSNGRPLGFFQEQLGPEYSWVLRTP